MFIGKKKWKDVSLLPCKTSLTYFWQLNVDARMAKTQKENKSYWEEQKNASCEEIFLIIRLILFAFFAKSSEKK